MIGTSIKTKPLLILIVTFILFTVIGTISHEYGHIAVAKFFGFETTLHYGSMTYDGGELRDHLLSTYNKYQTEIKNGIEFENKANYEEGIEKLNCQELLVTAGGPFQTILTGTIGILLLLWRKKSIDKNGLKPLDWLAVFLALFWLREVFNVVISFTSKIIAPEDSWFGGDELHLSQGLQLWPGTFSIILAFIGFLVALYVIFKTVPREMRFTFILGGFIGGSMGFVTWMNIIGPIVLP